MKIEDRLDSLESRIDTIQATLYHVRLSNGALRSPGKLEGTPGATPGYSLGGPVSAHLDSLTTDPFPLSAGTTGKATAEPRPPGPPFTWELQTASGDLLASGSIKGLAYTKHGPWGAKEHVFLFYGLSPCRFTSRGKPYFVVIRNHLGTAVFRLRTLGPDDTRHPDRLSFRLPNSQLYENDTFAWEKNTLTIPSEVWTDIAHAYSAWRAEQGHANDEPIRGPKDVAKLLLTLPAPVLYSWRTIT